MLGVEPITVTREAVPGTWSKGKYVPGETTTFTVYGSVQPLQAREIEMLPEKARTKARWALLCELGQRELRCTDLTKDAHAKADRIQWNSREYVMFKNGDWTGHEGGLPHHAYAMIEVGKDEVADG